LAHELAVLELAPDAIRRDFELLRNLFLKFINRAVLDYAHVMTRLPELHEYLIEHDATPDSRVELELEELSQSIPKLITILPEALRDRSDIRRNVALVEIITGLILRLDKVKPLALSHPQAPSQASEATKLRHIHSTAYERFLKTIEVS
jgi:nuclear pore complex protein Nup98-Nup96